MKRCILLIFFVLICSSNSYARFSVYLDNKYSVSSREITSVKISKNGRFLAYGTREGKIFIWDIKAKRQLHEILFHKKVITELAFDSKNEYLITGSEDKKVVIWDLYSGKRIKVIKVFKVNHFELSPDDRILAVCGKTKNISLFEFPSGEKKGDLKGGHTKEIIYVTYNLNGDQIVSVGRDNRMIFWDPSQLKLIRKNELSPNKNKNKSSYANIISCIKKIKTKVGATGFIESLDLLDTL